MQIYFSHRTACALPTFHTNKGNDTKYSLASHFKKKLLPVFHEMEPNTGFRLHFTMIHRLISIR